MHTYIHTYIQCSPSYLDVVLVHAVRILHDSNFSIQRRLNSREVFPEAEAVYSGSK